MVAWRNEKNWIDKNLEKQRELMPENFKLFKNQQDIKAYVSEARVFHDTA